jgi:hypothetical protein
VTTTPNIVHADNRTRPSAKRMAAALLGVMAALVLASVPAFAEDAAILLPAAESADAPALSAASSACPYLDVDGTVKISSAANEVTAADTIWGTDDTETWYVVNGNVTLDGYVRVQGNVSLILADGCSLVAPKGICVEDANQLTVYSQKNGTGALTATGENAGAGIGCRRDTSGKAGGTIILNGGRITARGDWGAAGIGGGCYKSGGTIVINGGTINAAGGVDGAGIGTGFEAKGAGTSITVTINGGDVTATGYGGDYINDNGIGFSTNSTGDISIVVHGGVVRASGPASSDYSGGLWYKGFTMDGGVVFANRNHWRNGDLLKKYDWNTTKGVLFDTTVSAGQVMGDVTLPRDLEIPAGYTLTIPSGTTLVIPSGITLTNNGTIDVQDGGTLTILGDVSASETSKLEGNGTVNRKATSAAAPTLASKTDTSVTLDTITSTVADPIEYACVKGTVRVAPLDDTFWQDSPVFTGLNASRAYTFFVRHSGSDYYDPSYSTGLSVATRSAAPTVGIVDTNADAWALSTAAGMEYSTDGGQNWAPCAAAMAATSFGWVADGSTTKAVLFRYAAVGAGEASGQQSYAIPARAATPNVTIDYPAGRASTTSAMEWMMETQPNVWTTCTDNMTLDFLGRLAKGNALAYVRVKAAGDVYASAVKMLDIYPPQAISAQPTTDSLTFGVTTTNPSPPDYQWQRGTATPPAVSFVPGDPGDLSWEQQGRSWVIPFSPAGDPSTSEPMHARILVITFEQPDDSTLSFGWSNGWMVYMDYRLSGPDDYMQHGALRPDGMGREETVSFDHLVAGTYTLDVDVFVEDPSHAGPYSSVYASVTPADTVTWANIDGATDDTLDPTKDLSQATVRCVANYSWGDSFTSDPVVVPYVEDAPAAAVDYPSEKFGGLVKGVTYLVRDLTDDTNGVELTAADDGTIPIDPSLPGHRISIARIASEAGHADSDEQRIDLSARPVAPTGLSGVNTSFAGEADGKISGLSANSSYEFSSDGGKTWAKIPAETEVAGLSAGSYQVRFAASQTSFASVPLSVAVGSGAERTYALTVTPPVFDGVTYGDAQPAAKALVISSGGNTAATIASVTSGSADFIVGGSGASVPVGGSIDSWVVQPAAGLSAGTHVATITVVYDGGATATADVSITVAAATQAAPAPPALASATSRSITLVSVAPSPAGASAQYRVKGGEWQDSPVFEGLSASTSYDFEIRYAESPDHNYAASEASPAASFSTTAAKNSNPIVGSETSDVDAGNVVVGAQETMVPETGEADEPALPLAVAAASLMSAGMAAALRFSRKSKA